MTFCLTSFQIPAKAHPEMHFGNHCPISLSGTFLTNTEAEEPDCRSTYRS